MLRISSFTQPALIPFQAQKPALSNSRLNSPTEQKDTFTRNNTVSFRGNTPSSSEGNYEDAPVQEQVWRDIRYKSSIPGSLPVLGRCMESVVYKVSDNFVFRVPIKYEGTNWDIRKDRIYAHPNNEPELRKITNIGRPVAKIYIDNNPIYFHRLMPGEKASINYNQLTLGGEIPSGQYGTFNAKYRSYLDTISKFNEGAFKNLHWVVHQLDKAGYAIDPGANNLMVDADEERFAIVDYKETSQALRNGMFPVNEHNNLAYVMAMLLDMQYKSKIRGNYGADANEQKLCRTILEKTLIAAADLKYYQKASVKLPSSSTFHLRHLNDKSCNSFTPKEIFEACGLKESNWKEIRKALIEQEKGNYYSHSDTVDIIKRNVKP